MKSAQLAILLERCLSEYLENPAVRRFKGGVFLSWKEKVRAILTDGLGQDGAQLLRNWDSATNGLPMPETMVDPGHLEGMFEDRFVDSLPNVEVTLKDIINILKTPGLLQRTGNKNKPKLIQRLWNWIESHKIFTILGAVAAIATIIGVVFSILNA